MQTPLENELSAYGVSVEESNSIIKASRKKAGRHAMQFGRRLIEFGVTSSGAVILAGPAVIHEVGAETDIARTAIGLSLGIISVGSMRGAWKESNLAQEALYEGSLAAQQVFREQAELDRLEEL